MWAILVHFCKKNADLSSYLNLANIQHYVTLDIASEYLDPVVLVFNEIA